MTGDEFKSELARLQDTWPRVYKRERVNLIWLEVKGLPQAWLYNLVSGWIAERRSPPLVKEFRQEATKYREWLQQSDKVQNEKDAQVFMTNTCLPDQEIRFRIDMIKGRMKGRVDDATWSDFINNHLKGEETNDDNK